MTSQLGLPLQVLLNKLSARGMKTWTRRSPSTVVTSPSWRLMLLLMQPTGLCWAEVEWTGRSTAPPVPMLVKECASLQGCETGQAKITCGYGLPAKYVIHTVGPIAQGRVGEVEKEALRSCYRNSLNAATQHAARSVAFPCISTGIYDLRQDHKLKTLFFDINGSNR
ncbi:hypothetical protein fugu_013762 [Takifugu bimaculatus]|uniref:Macro domain-containing protein n=1 Tax=Takifugu bimaculatus TaxID=433685 RepID=A0A4Z2C4W6_9TELE|nr:hypothetical protein fugu_013762 [Takifugu bimaculatus]